MLQGHACRREGAFDGDGFAAGGAAGAGDEPVLGGGGKTLDSTLMTGSSGPCLAQTCTLLAVIAAQPWQTPTSSGRELV